MQRTTAAAGAVALACVALGGASAQDKTEDVKKLDTAARIRDIYDEVLADVQKGEPTARVKAGAHLADLIDIRNGPLFEKLTGRQKARAQFAIVHLRLALGRAREAVEIAEKWVEADAKDALAWATLYEAAVVAGDAGKANKAYAKTLEGIQLLAPGDKPVKAPADLPPKEKEAYDARQKQLRDDSAKWHAKLMGVIGKKTVASFGCGLADGTGRFNWKKNGGKALVLAFWSTKVGNPKPIQDTYRELHRLFGEDQRVQFLGVAGFPNLPDRPAEFDALLNGSFPGATALDHLFSGSGLYQRLTGNLGCPMLWVVSAGGTVVHAGASGNLGDKQYSRRAAYALLATLQAQAEKAGAGGGTEK
jgi:hypothetical protein